MGLIKIDMEKQMKQKGKGIEVILLICILFLLINLLASIITFARVAKAADHNVKIQEQYDDFMNLSEYHLVADNVDIGEVDYNKLAAVDIDGKYHFKAKFLIEELSKILVNIILILSLNNVFVLIKNLKSSSKPFSDINIRILKMIGTYIILLSFLPSAVNVVLSFMVYYQVIGKINFMAVVVLLLGIAMIHFADLLKCGKQLQDELDFIS